MENFDVYDMNGNKTGIVMEKGQLLKEGQYKMAVNTWFLHDNCLLVQKRAENLRSGPGKWSATSGGSISGEEPVDTAIRECFEEIGVLVEADKFIQIDSVKDDKYIIYIFIVEMHIKNEEMRLQETEVSEVGWKTVEEVEHLMESNLFFVNMKSWESVKNYIKKLNKI